MEIDRHPLFDHEEVISFGGDGSPVAGLIAVHSTALGPAFGGCRITAYADDTSGIEDALRLSKAMSLKTALAGLAAGGGKAVIYRVDPTAARETILNPFADALNGLRGRYITAEDVGTSVADMQLVGRRSPHVTGVPGAIGRAGGDPSVWTARGVYEAMRAAVSRPLAGQRVSVQGLGSVGYNLCQLLHEAGARLVVADIIAERAERARAEFSAEVVSSKRIHAADADVFAPNALGAVLNDDSIRELGAPLVCGGANNQLASPDMGWALLHRRIAYVPDFLANAGGVISVVCEFLEEEVASVEERVSQIHERTEYVLRTANAEAKPPHEIAEGLAWASIRRAREERREADRTPDGANA